jgi:hypothetical protein
MPPTSIVLPGYTLPACPHTSSLPCPFSCQHRFHLRRLPAGRQSEPRRVSVSSARGGALQLTNDSNSVMGRAFFFDSPVQVIRVNSVVSFNTTFVLDIVTADSHGGGCGLAAFVIYASKVLPGATDGTYIGLLGDSNNGNSSNHVFAVEFDTMQVSGSTRRTATTSASTSTALCRTCRSGRLPTSPTTARTYRSCLRADNPFRHR